MFLITFFFIKYLIFENLLVYLATAIFKAVFKAGVAQLVEQSPCKR